MRKNQSLEDSYQKVKQLKASQLGLGFHDGKYYRRGFKFEIFELGYDTAFDFFYDREQVVIELCEKHLENDLAREILKRLGYV